MAHALSDPTQRIVYHVLTEQDALNSTFKGKPLSRTKQPKWPRLASPPTYWSRLSGELRSRAFPPHLIAALGGAAADVPLRPACGLRTPNGVWPPGRRPGATSARASR